MCESSFAFAGRKMALAPVHDDAWRVTAASFSLTACSRCMQLQTLVFKLLSNGYHDTVRTVYRSPSRRIAPPSLLWVYRETTTIAVEFGLTVT
jgi:hypothetical protein